MSTSNLDLYRQILFPSLLAGVRIAGLFRPRIREGYQVRRDWSSSVDQRDHVRSGIPRVHVHVASAGELEQGLGIRKAVNEICPDLSWSLSFTSPSGREHFEQQGEEFDIVSYLPLDRSSEIRAFLDLIRPDIILFIRYDVWPLFVAESRNRRIPMMLACGTISDGALHTPLIRSLTVGTYAAFDRISAVSETQAGRLRRVAPGVPVSVDGDARLDRVLDRHDRPEPHDVSIIRRWVGERHAIVLGSTWEPDEALWKVVDVPEGTVLVIAPHRTDPEHITELTEAFPGSILLSGLPDPGEMSAGGSTLIVDRVGILADVYRLARLVWVGGGFGEGIHSVAEPAAVGIPVLSGPRISRAPDALSLLEAGGLRVVETPEALADAIPPLVGESEERKEMVTAIGSWVAERRGGSRRIAQSLIDLLERYRRRTE